MTTRSIETASGPPCYIGHGMDAVSKEIERTLDFLGVPGPEPGQGHSLRCGLAGSRGGMLP